MEIQLLQSVNKDQCLLRNSWISQTEHLPHHICLIFASNSPLSVLLIIWAVERNVHCFPLFVASASFIMMLKNPTLAFFGYLIWKVCCGLLCDCLAADICFCAPVRSMLCKPPVSWHRSSAAFLFAEGAPTHAIPFFSYSFTSGLDFISNLVNAMMFRSQDISFEYKSWIPCRFERQ